MTTAPTRAALEAAHFRERMANLTASSWAQMLAEAGMLGRTIDEDMTAACIVARAELLEARADCRLWSETLRGL